MANVKGFRLTLPDGTEFFGRGDLSAQIEHQHQFLLSGGNTVIGVASGLFADTGGSSAVLKTPLATGHIGAASGSRIFEISFAQWKGSSDSWGPAAADDSIAEKMAVLSVELAKAETSSLAPAELEFGPFSSGTSRYDAVPVVVLQASPTLDFTESGSIFTPRLTLAETVDLGQAIDGSGGVASADYQLDSSGTSITIPIAADTLGAGGRGTGRQQQGAEVASSGLAEKNAASGSSASPTSTPTKILGRSVQLNGAFRGSNAASLAADLRTEFLSNPDVETVTLSAPGLSGTTPLTGTYTLGSDSFIDPIVPQIEGGVYGFGLNLEEA